MEQPVVAHLDERFRFCSYELVSIGTKNATLIHPRELFRGAIVLSAAAILLMCNQPSVCDVQRNEHLIEAGDLLGIDVLDHIVIGRRGDNGWVSLLDLGYFSRGS